MGGRKNFSWYNEMSVEHLLMAMKDECRIIGNAFSRDYAEMGLDKLIKASRTAPEFRNLKDIEQIWRLIQPGLRTHGVLKQFDTPLVKMKIAAFIKGQAAPPKHPR